MITKLSANRRFNEDGFTLVELLIVVIIIGILAAIAIPLYLNQQNASIEATIKSDIRNTLVSMQAALAKNGGESFNGFQATITDKARVVATGQWNYLACLDTSKTAPKYGVFVYAPSGKKFVGTQSMEPQEFTGPWTSNTQLCAAVGFSTGSTYSSPWGYDKNSGWATWA